MSEQNSDTGFVDIGMPDWLVAALRGHPGEALPDGDSASDELDDDDELEWFPPLSFVEPVDDEELRSYHAGLLDVLDELALERRMIETEGSLERLSRPLPPVDPRLAESRRHRLEALFGTASSQKAAEASGSWTELVRVPWNRVSDALERILPSGGPAAGMAAAMRGTGGGGNFWAQEEVPWHEQRIDLNLSIAESPEDKRLRVVCDAFDHDQDAPLAWTRLRLRSDWFSSTEVRTNEKGRAEFVVFIGREWLRSRTDEQMAEVFAIDILDEPS